MTTTTRNEAAERLRVWILSNEVVGGEADARSDLDEALAAERRATEQEYEQRISTLRATADRATARADEEYARGCRATVERIRARLNAAALNPGPVARILDEEAAR